MEDTESISSESDIDSPSKESGSTHSSQLTLKVLVSNNAAGSIIGRSGQTISELQGITAARIKLSQSGDCYPGTADRICLIQGNINSSKKAVDLIIQKIYGSQISDENANLDNDLLLDEANQGPRSETIKDEGPLEDQDIQEAQDQHDPHQKKHNHPSKNAFFVRLLIPNPACGMIIGRGGSNIKELTETSGVSSVRLSSKDSKPPGTFMSSPVSLSAATAERILTITSHDLHSCVVCTHLILDNLQQNPDLSRYSNMSTSYSKFLHQHNIHATHIDLPANHNSSVASSNIQIPQNGTSRIYVATSASPSTFNASQLILDKAKSKQGGQNILHIRPDLQNSNHDKSNTISDSSRFDNNKIQSTSASNIILPTSSYRDLPQQTMYLIGTNNSQSHLKGIFANDSTQKYNADANLQTDTSNENISSIEIQRPNSSDDMKAGQPNKSTLASEGAVSQDQMPISIQLAVPDSHIGAVLGKGGQTLMHLRMSSDTDIKISQRGEFVPGTKNRIVTISGRTLENVAAAQFIINQRIQRTTKSRNQNT
mmetsp:Transcript_7793/g.11144  ORF Transcript_7793/g.11144 Transcript_7793/m.11144 type:complete len:541 (-) Transcript_7793:326-1948(-)|eukprot:CAMPEP_0184864670 /NCGR_PEP_ID=MMETSP0580-20130426/15807_1 /TAXON_ID=1118495 /ORGANISM="Dactyliosolen fragilissimus" /LENGTH=540 /DNA_ID=CAMNT_0027363569 /DNA_START=452 /DNA_END=2074 /DNA_ORIENTATION=-